MGSGCIPYKFTNEAFLSQEISPEDSLACNQKEALSHPLYAIIPRHRYQIRWYDFGHWMTWALFGNDDDGIFGEEPNTHYRLEEPNDLKKACAWQLRNSFHNFCFYVIGTANQPNSEVTLFRLTPCDIECCTYRPIATTIFPCKQSCLFFALHGWKPFISLRLAYPNGGHSDFYLGWRNRGNFGMKCILYTKRK